jgi:hypothetical protein
MFTSKFTLKPTYLSAGLIMIGNVGTRELVYSLDQDESHYLRLEDRKEALEDLVDVVEAIFGPPWQSILDSGLKSRERLLYPNLSIKVKIFSGLRQW